MAVIKEHFLRGSNNILVVNLLEDGSQYPNGYSNLYVKFLGTTVTLTRTSNQNGITFIDGTLTINPADLLAQEITDLAALNSDMYQVTIEIEDPINGAGVFFGEGDTSDKLYFIVRDPQ